MNGLSLFSGIGGLDLALSQWVQPVAYCEIDRYARAVLLSRMLDGKLHRAPIWDDVTSLRGDMLPRVDIIHGGFPCQDISVAGTGAGLGGKRSGLFSEIVRLTSECRPRFLFLENVPAIIVRGMDRVLMEIDALGYDARWTVVSAAEMGAAHIRKRWFLLAHANGVRLREECGQECGQSGPLQSDNAREARDTTRAPSRKVTPRVFRANDGLPYSVDRAKCLGNSVHVGAAREAFVRLMGL